MDTTSRKPNWDFRRKGLVRAPDSPDSQAFLPATLLISHNIDTEQGIISIRVTLNTSNPARPSQELTLVLPPESVENCSWTPKSDDHFFPSRPLSMVPRHGADASSISTLSLELNTTATVFVPLKLEPLSPHTKDMLNFRALEKISQSKILYIHFGKDQFTNEEIHPLQIFLGALRGKRVETLYLDHKRHGLARGNLDTLRQALLPPSYTEKPVSEQKEQVGLPAYRAESSEQMIGKQHSAPLSILPDDERQTRLLFLSSQSLGSDTEVNTPSTDSLSTLSPSPPPIRPTIFTPVSAPAPGCAEINKLTDLERQLRCLPDDAIRTLLTRAGHGHLLKPDIVDRDLAYASSEASFAQVGENNCHPSEDYVNAMIQRHLQSFTEKVADENRDLLYDFKGELAREFHDELDERNLELRNAADDFESELQAKFHELIDQLDAKCQQLSDNIQAQGVAAKEENIAKFKFDLARRRQPRKFRLASRKRQYLTRRRLRG